MGCANGSLPLLGNDQLPPSDQEDRPKTGQRWRGLEVCSVYPLGRDTASLLVICSGSVVNFEGDAIVNAANEGCISGGGVDGAITAAGGTELAEARLKLPIVDHKRNVRCPVGEAKLTIGGRLKAQFCIHAVGPDYKVLMNDQMMPMEECDKIVSKTYHIALECAKDKMLRRVAFSLISASIFRGPQTLEAVLEAGIDGIKGNLYPELQEVALVAFTQIERTTLEMLCGKKFLNAKGPEHGPVKEKPPALGGPKFTIMIVGARGIRNTDWMPGLSKPHCHCEAKRGDKVLFTTKSIKDSMVPRWVEEFDVWELEQDEQLEFKVWDTDVVGAECLGKVIVAPDTFMEHGCNQDFPMEAGQNTRAFLGLKIKVQGQEQYSEGPPPKFQVVLEKGEAATEYGLEIDTQDQKHFQICKVDEVAFKRYNESVDPSVQVIKSDFIISVNGATGAPDMMKQFQKPKVTLWLVRALDAALLLENKDKKKHGLKFPRVMTKNDVLVVMEIGDGYIKEHNDKCEQESQKILVYDRIVSVKGQVGNHDTLKGLLEKAIGKFQLGIQRPCPVEIATKAPGGNFRFW